MRLELGPLLKLHLHQLSVADGVLQLPLDSFSQVGTLTGWGLVLRSPPFNPFSFRVSLKLSITPPQDSLILKTLPGVLFLLKMHIFIFLFVQLAPFRYSSA